MKLTPFLKSSAKIVALEVVAVAGAIGYVLFSDSLSDRGGAALAGLLISLLIAAIVYAFARTVTKVRDLWRGR